VLTTRLDFVAVDRFGCRSAALNTLGHQAFPAEVGNEHLAVKMIDGSGNGRGIRRSGAMLTWFSSRGPVRDGRAPARGCRKVGRNTTADARYDR
jgi:hypothetical protein